MISVGYRLGAVGAWVALNVACSAPQPAESTRSAPVGAAGTAGSLAGQGASAGGTASGEPQSIGGQGASAGGTALGEPQSVGGQGASAGGTALGEPQSVGGQGASAGGTALGEPEGVGGQGASAGGEGGEPEGVGGQGASAGGPASGGSQGVGGQVAATAGASAAADSLGAYPFEPSPTTRGGTMSFTNIGAAGWWPRRLDRAVGDSACDYKDGLDTWGGHCCQQRFETTSENLAPFDEEMTLVLKALNVKQLAVYQPETQGAAAGWRRATSWDARTRQSENLWFTRNGEGSSDFPGDLTGDDCVGYLMQSPFFDCGDGSNYFCPNDPGVLHQGFTGSKLIVFLASMNFDDTAVSACDGSGAGHPGPWVAFVASELVRDGGRKWNGECNCYSKTGSVGDGCGEINVFEVVMDGNEYSNREFMSTGLRSYQAGHVGGSVCMADCDRDAYPEDAEVVDACAQLAYGEGPEIVAGGGSDGCPVWRRPDGDRYFVLLMDENRRQVQVGVIHPANIPEAAASLLPELPGRLTPAAIDGLLEMRLPN